MISTSEQLTAPYYNTENNTLYVFNNNGVYKITESSISLEKNGTDGIIFQENKNNAQINADLKKPLTKDQRKKLLSIITENPNYSKNGILTPDEAKTIFETWLYSLFFSDIMSIRPILALTGEKGSGKTFALKLIQYLFADNNEQQANNFLYFLDNVNGKEEIQHTSTNPLQAITSRTPNSKKNEIADRLLPIQLDRYEHFTPEMELYEKVEKHKNDIWLAILYELQEILKALKTPYTEKIPFRIAEYAKFSLQIAQHKNSLKEMQNIFKKLSQSQSDFTLEEDPIFMALDIWIENSHQNGGVVPEPNNGREIISKDLYKELKEIAQDEDFWFPKSAIDFAKRLSNIKSNLGKHYKINNRLGKSRTSFLTFTKKEEKII